MPPDHQAAPVSDIAKQMGLHLNHLMDSVTRRDPRSMWFVPGKKATTLPGSVFGQRAEPHEGGLVVEVAAVLFSHGDGVCMGLWDGAAAVDHVGHRANAAPDREGRERAGRANRGGGERGAGVARDQAFDRPPPFQEPGSSGSLSRARVTATIGSSGSDLPARTGRPARAATSP